VFVLVLVLVLVLPIVCLGLWTRARRIHRSGARAASSAGRDLAGRVRVVSDRARRRAGEPGRARRRVGGADAPAWRRARRCAPRPGRSPRRCLPA